MKTISQWLLMFAAGLAAPAFAQNAAGESNLRVEYEGTVGKGSVAPSVQSERILLAEESAAVQDVRRTRPADATSEYDEIKRRRGTLEEIVVTATKRRESLQDIPMSIAVIGNEDIERRGLKGMEDYLRSIPGVNQVEGSPINNSIIIRGISTSLGSENFSVGSSVATYFDETPITGTSGMGQGGGADVRPVDIERIEVLRGPQGTAYGSSSLGGTVRMIPVKPRLGHFGGQLLASYSDTSGSGSENSMVQGLVNIPVVERALALRIAGYRYDDSGFYRNIGGIDPTIISIYESYGLGGLLDHQVHDDMGKMSTTGGRLAAYWQITDRADVSLNLMTQNTEQDGSTVASAGKYDHAIAPIASQVRVRNESSVVNDGELNLANLVFNYDFTWADMTSVLSWVDSSSIGAIDLTPLFRYPASAALSSDFKSVSAEMRIVSKFEGPFQFLGGLFYEDVDEGFRQPTVWPGTGPSPVGTNPLGISTRARDLRQRAVFGEFSYDLTDQLTATVGGRLFKYDKDQSVLRQGGLFRTPLDGGTAQFLETTESDSSFKGDITYKVSEGSLVYASWSEGFRLGRPETGVPSATCDVNADGLIDGTTHSVESTRSIDSDFTKNYELGGKFTFFDRRMSLDTAVYHIKWDGLPVTATAPCGFLYFVNAGRATSDGVELQMRVAITEGLRIDFGGGYTKAELSNNAPGLGSRGARLPGSPQLSANLAAQYEFAIAGYRTFVRLDSFYTGEFYATFLEAPNLRSGDYTMVDTRTGIDFKNLSVELFVRNLTDEDAFTWRAGNTNLGGYRVRPRTVGIQLGYNF